MKLKTIFKIIFVIVAAIVMFFYWAKKPTVKKSDYISSYIPIDINKPDNDSIVDVVSYNIGYLSGMTNNTAQKTNKEFYSENEKRVIKALKYINADVIGFQEIDFNSKRSYYTNQSRMISDSLGLYGANAINWDKTYVPFPYWPPRAHFGKIVSGQSILSKYPLKNNKVYTLEKVKDNPFYFNALYLERLAQISTVKHSNKYFKIINIHAEAFNKETRSKQLKYIYNLFKEINRYEPVILIGDLNSDPNISDEGIHLFLNDTKLTIADCNKQNFKSCDKTYPSINPSERLDYIIVDTTYFEILDSKVLDSFGDISDHFPLWARLRIK